MRSYSIANYKLSDRWRNVHGGSETSRWRTGTVARRRWSAVDSTSWVHTIVTGSGLMSTVYGRLANACALDNLLGDSHCLQAPVGGRRVSLPYSRRHRLAGARVLRLPLTERYVTHSGHVTLTSPFSASFRRRGSQKMSDSVTQHRSVSKQTHCNPHRIITVEFLRRLINSRRHLFFLIAYCDLVM